MAFIIIDAEFLFLYLFMCTKPLTVLKSSWAISSVNIELKTDVSEISSVSIVRIDVVNSGE
jgi:hypothetical protein